MNVNLLLLLAYSEHVCLCVNAGYYHIPSNSQFSVKLLLNQPVSNLVCHIEPHWQKKYISFSKSKRNGNLRKMVVTISHQEKRVKPSRVISHLVYFTMAPMPSQYCSYILQERLHVVRSMLCSSLKRGKDQFSMQMTGQRLGTLNFVTVS